MCAKPITKRSEFDGNNLRFEFITVHRNVELEAEEEMKEMELQEVNKNELVNKRRYARVLKFRAT